MHPFDHVVILKQALDPTLTRREAKCSALAAITEATNSSNSKSVISHTTCSACNLAANNARRGQSGCQVDRLR